MSKQWNVLDRYGEDTKLIYYSECGSRLENYKDHRYGDVCFEYRDEMLALQSSAVSGVK